MDTEYNVFQYQCCQLKTMLFRIETEQEIVKFEQKAIIRFQACFIRNSVFCNNHDIGKVGNTVWFLWILLSNEWNPSLQITNLQGDCNHVSF